MTMTSLKHMILVVNDDDKLETHNVRVAHDDKDLEVTEVLIVADDMKPLK